MTVTRAGIASLALLAAALVFGVVLGFVLAFGSSDTDSWEERWAELGLEDAEFVFLGDFTRGERAAIRLELKAAQVVFAEHFGAVTSDLRVYLATDFDLLNEAHTRDQANRHRWGSHAEALHPPMRSSWCLKTARLSGGRSADRSRTSTFTSFSTVRGASR